MITDSKAYTSFCSYIFILTVSFIKNKCNYFSHIYKYVSIISNKFYFDCRILWLLWTDTTQTTCSPRIPYTNLFHRILQLATTVIVLWCVLHQTLHLYYYHKAYSYNFVSMLKILTKFTVVSKTALEISPWKNELPIALFDSMTSWKLFLVLSL